MANYRVIQTTFWSDTKIFENFTPEDKFFYLYLMTNAHTNLCGCYELGRKQMSIETGYSAKTIDELLKRFERNHNVIRYSNETKEILLVNWYKYNWTSSGKYIAGVEKDIDAVKDEQFRAFLKELIKGKDTVSIPYSEEINPIEDSISNNTTNSISNSIKETIPPTVEMVREYIEQEKYSVDAQEFVDFYESKGWVVGKNKMRSWKAAVRTWEQRNKKDGTKKQKGWLFNE